MSTQTPVEETPTDVVIFGTGDFGEVARYFFTHDSPYRVAGFTADREYIESDEKNGLPVVPFDTIEETFPPETYALFVAVGYRDVNKLRAEAYEAAKARGYELVSYVHSSATVAENVDIGENTFLFEDQTVQPFVDIGDNVVLWSGNHIGHHSTIRDHCFVTSHVVVSGNCLVEPYSFLGVNATLIDEVTVGERTVVGAGATIVGNTQPDGVYTGEAASRHVDTSEESDI